MYCSQICKENDWFEIHAFECRGSLTQEEIRYLEEKNIFIKRGYLRVAQNVTPGEADFDDHEALARCKLTDLKFDTKPIGEGSFGQVFLATHKPTKQRVAVKKIPKKNMQSKLQTEKVDREIRIHE